MSANKYKILVIDDNIDNLITVKAVIMDVLPGAEILTAQNGPDGIVLAASEDPDVIVLDIVMPGMDGFEVCGRLKRDAYLQMIPVLFLTALKTDRELRERAIRVGAESFLTKPIDDMELTAQIQAMAKIKERNVMIFAQKEQLEYLVAKRTSELRREIAERQAAEDELRRSEEKFRKYIEMSPLGVFVMDEQGKCIEVNDMGSKIIGCKREELVALSILDFFMPEHQDIGRERIREAIGNGSIQEEFWLHRKNGRPFWASFHAVRISEGKILAFCADITERKEREKKIEYMNYHDMLTGLYNRTFFEEQVVRLDTRRQLPLSIITCDIDGLKLINDALGHAEGDKLLVTMATIIKECIRQEDIAARVGGDEFSILLPKTPSKTAQEVIVRITAACKKYERSLGKDLLLASMSMGLATKSHADEDFASISNMAERFMYKRKLLEHRSFHSSLLSSIRTTLFEKSHETEAHAKRLVEYSRQLGQELGLGEEQLNDLALLATLHDIGKISIDDRILTKPSSLTEKEWFEMKKHPETGYRIAMASPELSSIAELILCHHERWDGKGYPQGLKGEQIPLLSRIIAVVDAFDAITSERCYRNAVDMNNALEEIRKNAGTQFDPVIAELFVEINSMQAQDAEQA